MATDISVLPSEQIMIVKEVHFEYELNTRLILGKAVYLRRLSDSYKLELTSKNEDPRYLELMKSEETYPFDYLDKLIIDGISSKYNNVNVTSWLMMCDTQYQRLLDSIYSDSVTANIIIEPDISSLDIWGQISWILKNKMRYIQFPIDIYMRGITIPNLLQNNMFKININLDEWQNQSHGLKELLDRSYVILSKYFR